MQTKNEARSPVEERHTRQLLLSRYYLELAEQQSRLDHEAARFAAINMLHEAFETSIVCFADALSAEVPNSAPIDKIVVAIEKKLDRLVPFRSQIFRFNKIRVNAKHHLVMPDQGDIASYMSIIPEFIKEITRLVFSVDLSEVSLANLISDPLIRQHMQEAVAFLAVNSQFECLVSCRRALYLAFEKQFDISPFLEDDGSTPSIIDPRSLCRAPLYAKSRRYIAEQVKEPFDLIVIDHGVLEGDLMKDGIDTHAFWNIWRLTPRVYQRPNGNWINSYSPDYRETEKSECAYVLDTLTRMILQRQARRGSWRFGKSHLRDVRVRAGAPYFEKASASSKQLGVIPFDLPSLSAGSATPSFDDDTWFYHVWSFGSEYSIAGYIRFADVIGEPISHSGE